MKYNLALLTCLVALVVSCHKKPVKTEPQPVIVYHKDGDVKKLLYNDANGVNLVILGDAFIKADLDTGGYYDQKVKALVDYFFTVSPYKENKQHFNIYVVYAESQKRGASNGYITGSSGTRFSSFFHTDITRLLEVGNYDTCYKYVQKAVPLDKAHLMVVLVNDATYGGSGGALAVMSTHELSKYVMVHEIGHSFGNLADEYVDNQEAGFTQRSDAQYFPNTDTTDDPLKIKWAHYLDVQAYKGIVGAFAGGYYRATGVYRPENNSIMLDLAHPYYNAASREAITRHIDEILNTPFDFNAFLNADSASAQPATLAVGSIRPPMHDFIGRKDRIMLMKNKKK